jgi:hypothetical protein
MYRLKKYKQGWIVEYQKIYLTFLFFTIKEWKHITDWAGMPENPFYYKTAEDARDGALREIKDQIDFSFFFPNVA